MSKWLSIELSLLLLVSMVAFAGLVSWQNSGDELTGEAFFRPSPRPSCPVVRCPTCAPQYEVEMASGLMVPVSGTKPGLAEGDIVTFDGVKIEVLSIDYVKDKVWSGWSVSLKLNGQSFKVRLEDFARLKSINIVTGRNREQIVTVLEIIQQGGNKFVQLAVSEVFSIRYGQFKHTSTAADIHLISAIPSQVIIHTKGGNDFYSVYLYKLNERKTTPVGHIITWLSIKQV